MSAILCSVTLAVSGVTLAILLVIGAFIIMYRDTIGQMLKNFGYLSCCVGKVCEAVGRATGETMCEQKCSAPKYYCAGEQPNKKKAGEQPNKIE